MNRAKRERLIDCGRWHLSEAELLDQLANDPPPKPAPVASIHDMTPEWVEGTLGVYGYRLEADRHRLAARRIHDQLAAANPKESRKHG